MKYFYLYNAQCHYNFDFNPEKKRCIKPVWTTSRNNSTEQHSDSDSDDMYVCL